MLGQKTSERVRDHANYIQATGKRTHRRMSADCMNTHIHTYSYVYTEVVAGEFCFNLDLGLGLGRGAARLFP